jgi:hypothetical protein
MHDDSAATLFTPYARLQHNCRYQMRSIDKHTSNRQKGNAKSKAMKMQRPTASALPKPEPEIKASNCIRLAQPHEGKYKPELRAVLNLTLLQTNPLLITYNQRSLASICNWVWPGLCVLTSHMRCMQ